MLSPNDLAALARQMMDAQDRVAQIQPFSSRVAGFNLEAGYAIAELIHHERVLQGARPVGRKIGFTNRASWPALGVSAPIWAQLRNTSVVHVSGGKAICSLARFPEPKIEPEIVVRFRSPPPVDGTIDDLLATIDWVAHGFEIVQTHYAGWSGRPADTLADSSHHAALLVGEPHSVERLGAGLAQRLADFSVSLYGNGKLRETATGSRVLGSALHALADLAALLHEQGAAPLQPGELVTTGTITAGYAVAPGERWHTEIKGIELPGLAVEFV